MPANPPPTLAVADVAVRYAVTEQTVLTWIHAGELRAVNVGRRPGAKKPRWRVTDDALRAFESARAATPAPPPTPRRRRRQSAEAGAYYPEK